MAVRYVKINLIPKEQTEALAFVSRKRILRLVVGVVATALALFITFDLFVIIRSRIRMSVLRNKIDEYGQMAEQLTRLREDLDKLDTQLKDYGSLFQERVFFSRALVTVSTNKPKYVWLTDFSFKPGDITLKGKVWTDKRDKVYDFVEMLDGLHVMGWSNENDVIFRGIDVEKLGNRRDEGGINVESFILRKRMRR